MSGTSSEHSPYFFFSECGEMARMPTYSMSDSVGVPMSAEHIPVPYCGHFTMKSNAILGTWQI